MDALDVGQEDQGRRQTDELFGFRTTEANAIVAPVHAKAVPVILTTPAEIETWLTTPVEEVLKLQRPLPAAMLKIVATGSRQDPKELAAQ
jgi:putative SOS response-associated peptidase YedK